MRTFFLLLAAGTLLFSGCAGFDTQFTADETAVSPMTEAGAGATLGTDTGCICDHAKKIVNEGVGDLIKSRRYCVRLRHLFRKSLIFLAKGERIATAKPELLAAPGIVHQVGHYTERMDAFLEVAYPAAQAAVDAAKQSGGDVAKATLEADLTKALLFTVKDQIAAFQAFQQTQDFHHLVVIFGDDKSTVDSSEKDLFASQCGQYKLTLERTCEGWDRDCDHSRHCNHDKDADDDADSDPLPECHQGY
jgi:hypothetical protein